MAVGAQGTIPSPETPHAPTWEGPPGVLAFSELHLQDGQRLVGFRVPGKARRDREPRAILGICCWCTGGPRPPPLGPPTSRRKSFYHTGTLNEAGAAGKGRLPAEGPSPACGTLGRIRERHPCWPMQTHRCEAKVRGALLGRARLGEERTGPGRLPGGWRFEPVYLEGRRRENKYRESSSLHSQASPCAAARRAGRWLCPPPSRSDGRRTARRGAGPRSAGGR